MTELARGPYLFARGSAVLDYWLLHAKGMTVDPLGARVERVLVPEPFEPPVALVVRLPRSDREQTIPVEAIAAVVPAQKRLIMEPRRRFRRSRPARERAMRRLLAATGDGVAAVEWFAPRFTAATMDGAILVARGVGWTVRQTRQRGAERISSARRKARSSDWRALRRGSSSVS